MKPPICPYCNAEAELVDSAAVYGKSYGLIWLCSAWPDCDAYVGVHGNSRHPLGTLADAELRECRKQAHEAFDPLWRFGMMARSEAYELMAEILDIEESQAHIAMLDVEQCQKLCKALEEFGGDDLPDGHLVEDDFAPGGVPGRDL